MKRKKAQFPLYEIGRGYCFDSFLQTANAKGETEKKLYKNYRDFIKNIKLYLRHLK
jgi:hypothetical protein